MKLPVDRHTYYLIENRQPIGPDKNLPSFGVLISFCDDRIDECRLGKSPIKLINASPSIPQLKGAPFTPGEENAYSDEEQSIIVKIIVQKGYGVEIHVSNGI